MARSPYQIGGQLNFGSAPGMDYNAAYQNALNLNQQNYNNILQGYSGLANQAYNLTGDVMKDISGIEASQKQQIADQYAQSKGAANQSMINRGLSNTTARDAVQRGLTLDKNKADVSLANQVAGTRAQYRSQLGAQQLGVGQRQLDWMNSVNSPYPNVDSYLRQAMMRGATQGGAMGRAVGGGGYMGQSGAAGVSGGNQGSMMSARGFAPQMGYMGSTYGGGGGWSNEAKANTAAYVNSVSDHVPQTIYVDKSGRQYDSMPSGYGVLGMGEGSLGSGDSMSYSDYGSGNWSNDDGSWWDYIDQQYNSKNQQQLYSNEYGQGVYEYSAFDDPNIDWSFGEDPSFYE